METLVTDRDSCSDDGITVDMSDIPDVHSSQQEAADYQPPVGQYVVSSGLTVDQVPLVQAFDSANIQRNDVMPPLDHTNSFKRNVFVTLDTAAISDGEAVLAAFESSDFTIKKRTRKRPKQPEQYAVNIRKRKKAAGKEYISSAAVTVRATQPQPVNCE